MSFRYFAYGSNLWPPQMRSRCPSARVVGPAQLEDWELTCDKPSADGSVKFNIRPQPGASVTGVVYEIRDDERAALDGAELGYSPVHVELEDDWTLTYASRDGPTEGQPYDWYLAMAAEGVRHHGLPTDAPTMQSLPDPLAPDVRPVGRDDRSTIHSILSEGLRSNDSRYYVHPGDFDWWVDHDDPRHPDHFSIWIQGDYGFVVIDTIDPGEINVFTRPGLDRMPLVRWAQRRLGGGGEVGWVSDNDSELIEALSADGYVPVYAFRAYEWDLTDDFPQPQLPSGWELRAVSGEAEADNRRSASHSAFESTMDPAMHTQRYLDFMRSPSYVPEHDLVAVAPDGTIASFMVWWADESSGVAQIEPFGTHPAFHRQGAGRALLYHGLSRMKDAGMTLCRVCTDDDRPATGFYEGVGFEDVRRLRWWVSRDVMNA